MKKSFAFRLAVQLFLSMVVFSILIGLTFSQLFRQHTIQIAQETLRREAGIILSALSQEEPAPGMPGQGRRRMSGSRPFLRSLNQLTGIDAWIVDEQMQLITAAGRLQFGDLKEDAGKVVASVFEGKEVFSQGFSQEAGVPTLTLGMPVIIGGSAMGALLLHTPLASLEAASRQGLYILLVSLAVGLLISLLFSFFLSRRLTAPLMRLTDTTQRIAEGTYGIKTEIAREDEVGRLALAIDTLSVRLAAAEEESSRTESLRREFMANVSHELKTPVTVLRGSLEALRDGVVDGPDKVQQYYATMLSETKALDHLISDQLELSKLQSPEFALSMAECDLRDILQDAVASAQSLFPGRTQPVQMQLPDAPVRILGDYARLRQMVLIVLTNALRYSENDTPVSLSMRDDTLSIQDKGPGIAAHDLPHIFDRFYRGAGQTKAEGSGLGLSIVRQIADRHNILINVKSAPGMGTEFAFHMSSILI